MSKLIKTNVDYSRWIQELKDRYRSSQIKAAVKVTQEMLRFYWSVGRDIRKISVLTGNPAVKHIRNIRLMCSCELIDEGHTVSEAAFACGFNDLTYYRACFKEVLECPHRHIKSVICLNKLRNCLKLNRL